MDGAFGGGAPLVLGPGDVDAPCLRVDVDLARGLPRLPGRTESGGARHAWILVRLFTEPLGSVRVGLPEAGLEPGQVAAAVTAALGDLVVERAAGLGVPWPPSDPAQPMHPPVTPPFLASRARVLVSAPPMTVVICTRERPERLRACLTSVARQRYPRYTVLVVDNAPSSDRTRAVVREHAGGPVPIDYVVEPRPGLSRARNRAVAVAATDTLAWVDDDELADPDWLAELARGFHDHPEAAAVAGVMVPGALATPAQVWFEQYGGFNKHRGFTPSVFSPATADRQSPLYPLPPFGIGGNLAFRRSALEAVGGFDVALGAGTWSMAGEDTRALTDILRAGGTVVYQPTAVTQHFHRRHKRQLRRQMFGLGVGLTAFYTSLVVADPRVVSEFRRLLPNALRDFSGSGGLRSGLLPADFPADLRWVNRWGLLVGPPRYLGAALRARLPRRPDRIGASADSEPTRFGAVA